MLADEMSGMRSSSDPRRHEPNDSPTSAFRSIVTADTARALSIAIVHVAGPDIFHTTTIHGRIGEAEFARLLASDRASTRSSWRLA